FALAKRASTSIGIMLALRTQNLWPKPIDTLIPHAGQAFGPLRLPIRSPIEQVPCGQHTHEPQHIKPLRDLSPEHLRKHVKLCPAVLGSTAEAGAVMHLAAWLCLTGDLAIAMAVKTHAIFVARVDTAAPMAALADVATAHGPRLEP